jgi:hypothetical protein
MKINRERHFNRTGRKNAKGKPTFKDAITERKVSFEELFGHGDGDTGILGDYGDK